MKQYYLFLSIIVVLFIIFLNCQQPGGSGGGSGGGGGGGDHDPEKWLVQSKIIASDAEDNDNFGRSVSISGDYAIVGAPNEDGGGVNTGAAYIFHRTGANTWDLEFKITASDTTDNDKFGNSVSISGDYAIVGAPFKDDGITTEKGAVYIYRKTGVNTWGEEWKLNTVTLGLASEDNFGSSVSISGDYAIIGTPGKDNGGTDRGEAYVFQRAGTNTWGTGQAISPAGISDNDNFGQSVSISGDYAIVGVPNEDSGGKTDRGIAYIYHRRSGTNFWDGTIILAQDFDNGDSFGSSVSISGDYAIVSAPPKNEGGTFRGAAYIFNRTGANTWDAGTKKIALDAADGDFFGWSVSISGNYAIVGSIYGDGGEVDSGAAYVFQRIGVNTWNSGTKITSFDGAGADNFSTSVSISGNYIIVGASCNDAGVGNDNRGAAYIIK